MTLCVAMLAGCGAKKDTERAGIELVTGEFEPGSTLVVEFDVEEEMIDDVTAWIGVVPSNVEQGPEGPADEVDVVYEFLSEAKDNTVELKLPEALEEGAYDIRIYSSDDIKIGKQIGVASFTYGNVAVPTEESEDDKSDDEDDKDSDEVAMTDKDDAACLIGDWKITNFSEYLIASVKGSVPGGFADSAQATDSGDLILNFDGENMSMRDNNFVVTMTLLGTTTPVSIDASGTNGYTAENGVLKGAKSGNKVDVSESNGFSFSMENFASAEVGYECSGDSLTWKQNENFPVDLTFSRI